MRMNLASVISFSLPPAASSTHPCVGLLTIIKGSVRKAVERDGRYLEALAMLMFHCF